MSHLERFAHFATIGATVVALAAFALTSISENARAQEEERKAILDEVMIAILTEKLDWNEAELSREFSSRVANLDANVLQRSDASQSTFDSTLARLIISQSVAMLDENTVSLSSFAETARAIETMSGYFEQVFESLQPDMTRLNLFQASAGGFSREEITRRASYLFPDLSEEEVNALIQSEIDAGFIEQLQTPPNITEEIWGWVGPPPLAEGGGRLTP